MTHLFERVLEVLELLVGVNGPIAHDAVLLGKQLVEEGAHALFEDYSIPVLSGLVHVLILFSQLQCRSFASLGRQDHKGGGFFGNGLGQLLGLRLRRLHKLFYRWS